MSKSKYQKSEDKKKDAIILKGATDGDIALLEEFAPTCHNEDVLTEALVCAAEQGHAACIRVLLKAGAKVDGCLPGMDMDALEEAVTGGHVASVAALLDHAGVGAWGDLTEGLETPLHRAASLGDVKIIRVLLSHGMNRNSVDKEKRTPFKVAQQCGHRGAARLLEPASVMEDSSSVGKVTPRRSKRAVALAEGKEQTMTPAPRRAKGMAAGSKRRRSESSPATAPTPATKRLKVHGLKEDAGGRNSEANEEYEVERIVMARRMGSAGIRFLVQWKGYTERTWEPKRNLTNAMDLVVESLRKMKKKESRNNKAGKEEKKESRNNKAGKEEKKDRGTGLHKRGKKKSDENPEYQVERVVGVRARPSGREYRVKWAGYPTAENTWEPETHLANAKGAIAAFERSQSDTFEVEKVVAVRKRGVDTQYLVKWRGYSAKENTWEPAANLASAPKKLAEFKKTAK